MTYATASRRGLTLLLKLKDEPSYFLQVDAGFYLSIIYFQSCPRLKPAKTFHIPQHLAHSINVEAAQAAKKTAALNSLRYCFR